jgi:hypothetical protein
LRHELTGRRFARAQDLHEYARLYEQQPADAHPQSIYGVVYATLPLGHPPTTTPVPTGRTLGSGLTYPDSDRFLALLQPAVLAFRQERGRWPTRQEAIDSVTWPDHKPSLDIFKNRFKRACLTYTQWVDTLKSSFP